MLAIGTFGIGVGQPSRTVESEILDEGQVLQDRNLELAEELFGRFKSCSNP